MRIGVYGGSFNPPHVGHAMVAAWLSWTRQVDEVWLLPSFAHPFGKELLPWQDRLSLAHALAEAVGPTVKVSPIEASLPTPSFSIDSLTALAVAHPTHRFRMIVGADVLPETPKWKEWDRIEAQFSPIVVGRGGYPALSGVPTFPEVSSTVIRQRLRDGLEVDALVPATVLEALEGCSSNFSSR